MNKYRWQSKWNLVNLFTSIVPMLVGVGLVNATTVPVFADEPVVVYQQDIPTNSPQSFIYGSPIPTPRPVDPYTGQAPSFNNYSYPVTNFPPSVTYSYPANGLPFGNNYYSYPVTNFPPAATYSYPVNGSPFGNNYYSYPVPGTVVNSGPLNPILVNPVIINQPRHQMLFRGGRY